MTPSEQVYFNRLTEERQIHVERLAWLREEDPKFSDGTRLGKAFTLTLKRQSEEILRHHEDAIASLEGLVHGERIVA